VKAISEHFKPPQDKVDFARKVLSEFKRHDQQGKGAFEVDGKMIDMPMVLQARRTLQRAGVLDDD